MKKQLFRVGSDGYNGAWYPASAESKKGIILMLENETKKKEARLNSLPGRTAFSGI